MTRVDILAIGAHPDDIELIAGGTLIRAQMLGRSTAILDLAAGEMDRACATLEKVVKQSPQFLEAHVSLAQVYYRLKRKADGDRERAIVQKLKAEQDAKQPKGEAPQ